MKYIYLLLIITTTLFSQGLFESLESGVNNDKELNYSLGGYVKSAGYFGERETEDEYYTKKAFGEVSLSLEAKKGDVARGYSVIRFKKGISEDKDLEEFDIREGYVEIFRDDLELSIGQQIVVWGRADGINPTNVITPRDMTVFSSDEDDKRLSSFLFRSFYNLSPVRFEAIWLPVAEADVTPMPYELEKPKSDLKNSSGAFKISLNYPSFDGSISYFNGYSKQAGIIFSENPVRKMHRMHMIGADFSTTVSSYGLRGEIAYKIPFDEDKAEVPKKELHYILGVDREIGDFSVICQYIGKYIENFDELDTNSPTYQSDLMNRLAFSQTDEISHTVSLRLKQSFLYETLDTEIAGFYNFTTEEYIVRPKIDYEFTDAVSIITGAEIYGGESGSFFDMIDKKLSNVYTELKVSF